MATEHVTKRNPWAWVPSLYFAEGIPYVVVMVVSGIMYKRLGVSNAEIAFYTSLLGLPWALKPLWSPFIDMFLTKRFWTVTMQFVMGLALIGVAVGIPSSNFFQLTLVLFGLVAIASATHDIAADGFYMLGLEQSQQAAFVGVRSTLYRLAGIISSGALVVYAGRLEQSTGDIPHAWSLTYGAFAGMILVLTMYHKFVLPYPASDAPTLGNSAKNVWQEFVGTFKEFLTKKNIVSILLFILFYRFAESQLVKIASLFMLDAREKGGLALTTSQVGIVYNTYGVIALLLGGLLGGYAISRKGLKFWLWPMAFAINVPDIVYVYLSYVMPEDFLAINTAVVVEQFGYGFGFTAYMVFLMYSAQGNHKTAHYALCTGLMALGVMIAGMFSGWLQEVLGYQHFFVWIMIATIPSFVVTAFVKVEADFGKKKAA